MSIVLKVLNCIDHYLRYVENRWQILYTFYMLSEDAEWGRICLQMDNSHHESRFECSLSHRQTHLLRIAKIDAPHLD